MIFKEGWNLGLVFCRSAISSRSFSLILFATAVPSSLAATILEVENDRADPRGRGGVRADGVWVREVGGQ